MLTTFQDEIDRISSFNGNALYGCRDGTRFRCPSSSGTMLGDDSTDNTIPILASMGQRSSDLNHSGIGCYPTTDRRVHNASWMPARGR